MPAVFRLATPDDAEQIRAVYAPYCHTHVSFELAPPSIDEMRQRIEKVYERYPWLVCERDGEIIGYAYACPHRERAAYQWSVDTSVYVSHQRSGVGRGLYTSLFLMLPLQGYVNAHAGVTIPNPASVGLHEAMGFQPVGVYRNVGYKLGKWHDVAWYRRLLQSHSSPPSDLKSVHDIANSPAWESALEAGRSLVRL